MSVIREGKPIPTQHQHTELVLDAQRALNRTGYFALKGICCQAQGHILTVTGEVPSYYMKQVAQTVLATVPGVTGIDNQLIVTSYSLKH